MIAIAEVIGLAVLCGWVVSNFIDLGGSVRGLPFLSGLVGFYAGSWLAAQQGITLGPIIAGHPIGPALLGTMGIAGLIKLAEIGLAGPRW